MATFHGKHDNSRIHLLWLMILLFIAICWVAVLISR